MRALAKYLARFTLTVPHLEAVSKQSLAQRTVNAIGLSHPIVVTYLKSNIIKFYAVFHLENYAENVVKREMNHESGK